MQAKIREVLCTILIMQNAIEVISLLDEDDPFDINKKGRFRAVKKLYRDIYKPNNMTPTEVDEAVKRALDVYDGGWRP